MHHRLSKARTNTNSTSARNDNTSNNSTPSKPPSRGNDGASNHSEGNEDSNSPFAQHSPLSLSGEAYNPSNSTNALLSASTTSTTSLSSSNPANRASLADLSNIDIGAAIALLQELKKKASPEDLVALHKALLPARSNEADLQSSVPEAEGREESFSPLIRRSSLLPAGIATRMSADQLKKYSGRSERQPSRSRSRPAQRDERPAMDPMPATDTIDFADEMHESHESRAGRTETPPDFTYTGAYRIGSLRITNGAASPDPSIMLNMAEHTQGSRSASYESMPGDGFVTADEGDFRAELASSARNKTRGSPRWNRNQVDSETLPRARQRTAMPLKVETLRDSSADDAHHSSTPSPRSHLRQRASDMAEQYAVECETPSSPQTHASRLSPVEDSSPVDIQAGGPEEALQKLNANGREFDGRVSLGSESSASRTDFEDRTHLKVNRPSVGKSDSGYDSTCSWQAQARAMIKRSKVDDALKFALEAADRAETDRSRPSPPGPAHRSSLEHQRQHPDSVAVIPPVAMARPSLGGKWSEKHNSMPVFNHAPLPSSSSSTLVASKTKAPADKIVTPTTPTKQPKKLQKNRTPSQHQMRSITVQSSKETQEDVPSVPDNTSFNFSRRLDRTPEMSHLDHTFGSVAHTTSESAEAAQLPQASETLEKLNAAAENERPGRGRGRKQSSKSEAMDNESPQLEKKKSFFRLRGRSRSKSQKRSGGDIVRAPTEEDPMPTITDFGTVAQSLGGSPYDIATRQSRSISGSEARRVFHPHEISNALGGPVVGMDDATAAEFARMKSQQRAEQQGQNERARSQSRSRPRHVAECAVAQPSPAAASGLSTANSSRSRPSHKRSASAHTPRLTPILSLTDDERPPARSRQSYAGPATGENVLVGTIEIAGGVAQGRMHSTARRSQSAAPRSRSSGSVPKIEEMKLLPPIPKMPPMIASESAAEEKATPIAVQKKPAGEKTTTINAQRQLVSEKASPIHVQKRPSEERKTPTKPTLRKEATLETDIPASPSSPSHDAKHPGWPGWENQARLWRERRKSLGKSLHSESKTSLRENLSPVSANMPQDYTPTKEAPRHSPAIVISRYITPVGSELMTHAEDCNEDDPYRALHSANPTEHLPAKDDVDRTDSAISSSTYRTANSSKSHSSAGSRHSASYRAYRPSDAKQMSTRTSSPPSEQQSRAAVLQRRATAPPEKYGGLFDRFSGGLGYGWDRGSGFGGSAGTRASIDPKAARKSVVLSESYGVDLSDVPVFITRG